MAISLIDHLIRQKDQGIRGDQQLGINVNYNELGIWWDEPLKPSFP
jgi:hypothetical protein